MMAVATTIIMKRTKYNLSCELIDKQSDQQRLLHYKQANSIIHQNISTAEQAHIFIHDIFASRLM